MKSFLFELSEAEVLTFHQWKENLPEIEEDVFGKEFCYEFIFYPTGLGMIKRIRRMDGFEIDLTDYTKF